MKRKTQELLKESQLQNKPEYTEDELKEIGDQLAKTKDNKAGKIYALLMSLQYNPFLFQDWCECASEEFDYNGLFFSSLDNIPLVIDDITELDSIEDVVVKWRLKYNK